MGGYDHWNKHFTFLCSLVWPLIEPGLHYACIMHLIACIMFLGLASILRCWRMAMRFDFWGELLVGAASCSQRWKKNRNRWTFVGFLSSQSVLHFPKFPSNTGTQTWQNHAKSRNQQTCPRLPFSIFPEWPCDRWRGAGSVCHAELCKDLGSHWPCPIWRAMHIQLVGYFSLKSRHACTSIEECRSMLMLRCFALVLESHMLWSRAHLQCQQLVSWGGISWALESCIADLRWAGHCSLGTQIWEPGRTFAAWRKRLLAFAPFQLQYKAWSTFYIFQRFHQVIP